MVVVSTRYRVLFRRMREIMADSITDQDRLNQVVQLIAAGTESDVCSMYLLRSGSHFLELYASEGLAQEAVHKVSLQLGEGLVGYVAAQKNSLKLSNMWSHPAFVHKPETQEEQFCSFIGVPIIRDGIVVGVLVVQSRVTRKYDDDDLEILQTTAMVLAELIYAELSNLSTFVRATQYQMPEKLEGVVISQGLAKGVVLRHEAQVTIKNFISESPEIEYARLDVALGEVKSQLEAMLLRPDMSDFTEYRDILEAFSMFVQDKGWHQKLREAISTGLTAEAAVKRVQAAMRTSVSTSQDIYVRERLHDIEDLTNRVLRNLVGDDIQKTKFPDEIIIVARHMGPADLLDYDYKKVAGVILQEGSAHAHVAIIARALGVPVIGGVRDIDSYLFSDDLVLLDAVRGEIFVRPTTDIYDAFMITFHANERRTRKLEALRKEASITADGQLIELNINAGLLMDVHRMHEIGAEGIGLYRTEILFMEREAFPDVEVQRSLYVNIFKVAAGKPVVFRTLDVGGDKVLPYFKNQQEENPAMGWRAIRIGIDRPRFLRHQLRALLLAATETKSHLQIMFPMVVNVEEFLSAKDIFDKEKAYLLSKGYEIPKFIKVGAMLEVPSLIFQLDVLLQHVDFLSVGSNDLVQFLYAADRNHPTISTRYDILSPSVVNVLRHIVQACKSRNVPVSICGEMAGKPLEAMVLIACGFRKLSMPPIAVDVVRYMLRSMSVRIVLGYVDGLSLSSRCSLRDRLKSFAQDHNIYI